LAGISRIWKYWWLQKDETPRSEKILIGEYVSESEIELKLAAMGYGVLDGDITVGGGCLRKIGRTA